MLPTVSPRVPATARLLLRALPLVALVPLVPEAGDLVSGEPGALHALDQAAPDQLGTGALATLLASFAVTPVAIVTGWRWHLILRRDFGLWAFGLAMADLVIAALAATGGPIEGVAGQGLRAAGTMATLVLVPLAVTSNRWSMRYFARDWKRLHLLVYPALAFVGLHLYLLSSDAFAPFVALVGLLMVPRVPSVRRRIVAARKAVAHHLDRPSRSAPSPTEPTRPVTMPSGRPTGRPTRRRRRLVLAALVGIPVLAGVIPSAIAAASHGLDDWAEVVDLEGDD
jgi:sulfoxide reductase heme-binding subunit YedZ